jgi:hypothetical protein
MALTYSWLQFIVRIEKHFNNDYPGTDFSITRNELLLYVNEAMSSGIIGQVYNGAKVLGALEMPEAYILQFELAALAQDTVSGYWYTTLPQPPLSLPLGYSINRVYPATTGFGQGKDCIAIKAKRVGRRKTMPMQFGVRYWVTGQKLWLAASDGSSLLNQAFYVEMPSTRATNLSDTMNLPDDAAEAIFLKVIAKLKDRLGIPQDVIQDDLPSGRKDS